MNEVWNLDPLYKDFDDPAFGADLAKLKTLTGQVNDFAAKLPQTEPLTGLREGIRLMEELTQLMNRLGEDASLRQRHPQCPVRLQAGAGDAAGQFLRRGRRRLPGMGREAAQSG